MKIYRTFTEVRSGILYNIQRDTTQKLWKGEQSFLCVWDTIVLTLYTEPEL